MRGVTFMVNRETNEIGTIDQQLSGLQWVTSTIDFDNESTELHEK